MSELLKALPTRKSPCPSSRCVWPADTSRFLQGNTLRESLFFTSKRSSSWLAWHLPHLTRLLSTLGFSHFPGYSLELPIWGLPHNCYLPRPSSSLSPAHPKACMPAVPQTQILSLHSRFSGLPLQCLLETERSSYPKSPAQPLCLQERHAVASKQQHSFVTNALERGVAAEREPWERKSPESTTDISCQQPVRVSNGSFYIHARAPDCKASKRHIANSRRPKK